jgi:hypothetical protein
MDTFFSILSSFFPNERMKFLHHITNKQSFYPTATSIDILNYYFISEMYTYTILPLPTSKLYFLQKQKRRRRRGIYFDNPALAKYEALQNTILTNVFIGQQKKDELLHLFCKAQRTYFGFCHLARLFKRKHAKPNPSATDMCYNPLSTLKPAILIDLYDDKTRTMYTFRLSDILNIITTSLIHSPNFFADPQYIKNPYTNVPFTKAQLYNIYFSVRASPLMLPPLFHLFFLARCTLSLFTMKNECYIREEAIMHFERNATKSIKIALIKQMLFYHQVDMPHITIHPNIPDKILDDTFSNYLYDYLVALYSLQPEYKIEAYARIKDRLYEFSINNPQFGRLNKSIKKKKRIFSLPAQRGEAQITFSFANKEHLNEDGIFVFNRHTPSFTTTTV